VRFLYLFFLNDAKVNHHSSNLTFVTPPPWVVDFNDCHRLNSTSLLVMRHLLLPCWVTLYTRRLNLPALPFWVHLSQLSLYIRLLNKLNLPPLPLRTFPLLPSLHLLHPWLLNVPVHHLPILLPRYRQLLIFQIFRYLQMTSMSPPRPQTFQLERVNGKRDRSTVVQCHC